MRVDRAESRLADVHAGDVAQMKLRVLDLFSGIGGFSLGLERTGGFETAAFCEYAEFPRKVLAKHWPDVPIYPDVRELTAERLNADGLGRIDLICGGYPCQPFSYAGKREGAEDDRHLWPEMRRLVKTLRPTWVIGENVAGHITMGLDDVLADLDELGYAAQAFVIPACAVNAPHRRDRLWIVANAKSVGCGEGREERYLYQENGRPIRVRGPITTSASQQSKNVAAVCEAGVVAYAPHMQRDGGNDYAAELMGREQVPQPGDSSREEAMADTRRKLWAKSVSEPGTIEAAVRNKATVDAEQCSEDVAYAFGFGRCSRDDKRQDAIYADTCGETVGPGTDGGRWTVEPELGRVAHGVPSRVDRLKALGNAVVPQIPELIGRAILKSMEAA